MSKRAEEAASAEYPFVKRKFVHSFGVTEFDGNYDKREAFQKGYEQAEKDTIERAIDWLERNYPYYYEVKNEIGMTMGKEFRKAMEGE